MFKADRGLATPALDPEHHDRLRLVQAAEWFNIVVKFNNLKWMTCWQITVDLKTNDKTAFKYMCSLFFRFKANPIIASFFCGNTQFPDQPVPVHFNSDCMTEFKTLATLIRLHHY
ncbi:hypothetical protein CEXT_12131 [Caerostris extrusa]|uniref:Uncharacterized protein n=1 Tax=Caerostris extrusa TaxID=172846 RepID=A0AAV4PWZ2_CAEEX|nr:hypothetical protein CEXT_12131 [Caerostris extrusa]